MCAALEAFLIVTNDAKGDVKAHAKVPAVVQGAYIISKGHRGIRSDISVIGAGENAARVINIRAGLDRSKTATDLGPLQTRHARRVAKHGAGIQRRGRATSEAGAHAADALLVNGQAVCHQLAGGSGYGDSERGFEPGVFDHLGTPEELLSRGN